MSGILNGIGVGVGDPDMMTLKAIKTITASDYICLPREEIDREIGLFFLRKKEPVRKK